MRSGWTGASAQALAFVARRLLAEPVVMLFAAREPTDLFAGLPVLLLPGLRDADARPCWPRCFPAGWIERVADQLLAETRGNPLALNGATTRPFATLAGGRVRVAGGAAAVGQIEQTFHRRLEALPEDTQATLVGGSGRVHRRSGPPPGGRPSVSRSTPRHSSRRNRRALIDVDSRVRFRHPLVRSAIYRATTPLRRGDRCTGALAEATDAEVDPDRRAWHLAEAADGPDVDAATELERSAGRAQARGGLAAAAAFLERAAALTAEPSLRMRSGRSRRRRRSTRPGRSTTPSRSSPPRRAAAR